MTPQMIAGIFLAVVGAFIVVRGLNAGAQGGAIRVGDFQASVEARSAVPIWVGGVAVVGGVLLVGAGLRRRRAA